jgi:hypothetical protein
MAWIDAFMHNWVLDAAGHFLLASVLGLLAFWLTQIIFYVPLSMMYQLLRFPMPRAAIYGILALCLLLGMCFALISHAWLDGFAIWYITPSGPALNYGGM